jgi:hypothetical protein
MTIERPMFPPVDPTRRRFLTVAAAGAAAIATTAPAAASQTLDAELIELGARFEPLVDQYYAVHAIWAPALTRSHSEIDRKFGEPRDRGYQDTPEIRAAWEEVSEWNGLDDACARQSAIWEEMKPIADAINASPVTSIEGLRAKALVAFWEVAPLAAGDTEFSFEDAYPFQQLFTAVAELCGLKDKMVATGYELPDIAMVDDDSDDDDSDDEGEEA